MQSDYSIFDSQPQTAKVKKELEAADQVAEHLKAKRRSVSEKNILAALKSPAQNEHRQSATNIGTAIVMTTGQKISQQQATSQNTVTGKKKDKKKDKSKKTISNALNFATFEHKNKVAPPSKEADKDGPRQSRQRRKSRDGSLKFLTDRAQNIFGEKFSLATSNAFGGGGGASHTHRKHMNFFPFKREKSISKERKKDS